ncbi:MAG: hypothetical protein Q8P58_02745 [Candidatus Adlerbacteria bacterium]|nr:hypothetical protein [Candidatus Adlerbacteria bacterium]
MSLFESYKERLEPFWAKNFERFGIDEARSLIEMASLKNFGKQTFFIAAASLTTEAQQALLKLFEEPQKGTTFVLLVPHGSIIPTLRSRMMSYPQQGETLLVPARFRLATQFLKSTQKERSDYIAKLLKDDEGVREQVREFLNGLEEELHKNLQKTKQNKAFLDGLQDISKVRSYTNDRSPSLKMLLEHLALSLPTLK